MSVADVIDLPNYQQELDGETYLVLVAPVTRYGYFPTDEERRAFVRGLNYAVHQGRAWVERGSLIIGCQPGREYMAPEEGKWPDPPEWAFTREV